MTAADDLVALLDELGDSCAAAGRDDLGLRIRARRGLFANPGFSVVVAGEFKAGKSSLVNALLGVDVCPVDDDVATSVPIVVRYAPAPTLRARRSLDDDDQDSVDPGDEQGAIAGEPVDRLGAYATESGNPANREGVRAVEVGLPAAVLAGGLVLVDTPGVGGLGSAYTSATMAAVAVAHAVLFVSDASQEYTAPELDFLGAVRAACPEVVAVLNKIDIVPDWKRIRDLDDEWLERAGVAGGVVPTSAQLELLGCRHSRSDLRDESGIAEVVTRLDGVADAVRRVMAAAAVADAHAVVAQLASPLRAEHDALADPAAVIGPLEQVQEHARGLTGDGAEWLGALEDGMVDLEAELDEELGRRLKTVLADTERTVRAIDPAADWDGFEAALTRQVSGEIAAVSARLTESANALATRLAQDFAGHETAVAAPVTPVGELAFAADGPLVLGAGATPWRGVLVDAGWGGLEALGVLGSILTFTSISLFNPFSLVIGAFIGGKTLRDSRRRELERRREQAVEAVNRYVQEATRAADRELKSTTRRLRRELRTTYQRRADALYRSARESLAAAEKSLGADPAGRQARSRQLEAQLGRLDALDRRAAALTAGGR
ncbi:MAG TPA: dynamin family protein [Acidimicrobiales bacterium]|nr:dynamin family protein [Acidimicrobiales bacterium]